MPSGSGWARSRRPSAAPRASTATRPICPAASSALAATHAPVVDPGRNSLSRYCRSSSEDARRTIDRLHADRVLAQIGRPGLVRDIAARLTADFARNLDRRLSGAATGNVARGRTERNYTCYRLFCARGSRAGLVVSRPTRTERHERIDVPRMRSGEFSTADGLKGKIGEQHDTDIRIVPSISLAAASWVAPPMLKRSRSASTNRSRAHSRLPAPTSSTAQKSPPTRSTPKAACSARRSNSSSKITSRIRRKPPRSPRN